VSQVLDGNRIARKVVFRMRLSVAFWLIIATFQILFGILLILFGYGLSMIACGGWNIYASISRIRTSNLFSRDPSLIYPYFESSLDRICIWLAVNCIFGGIIGVLASVYDLVLRSFVVRHKEDLTLGLKSGGAYGIV